MRSTLAASGLIVLLLGACTDMERQPKQTVGTILGAAGGAVAGAQFGKGTGQIVATAIGTLAGAWVGSEIGTSLDRADRAHIQQMTQRALETQPSGTTTLWTNPDRNVEATVTPRPAFRSQAGLDCREYQQTITISGNTELARGTACRQSDGTWKIVSTASGSS